MKERRKRGLRMSQGVAAQRGEPLHRVGVTHSKAIKLLRRHAETGRGFLSYPRARQILSWLFHLDKKEARAFLKEMEERGLIATHGFKGIKIIKGGDDQSTEIGHAGAGETKGPKPG